MFTRWKAGMVYCKVKAVWSIPERFWGVVLTKRRCTNVRPLPFYLSYDNGYWCWWCCWQRQLLRRHQQLKQQPQQAVVWQPQVSHTQTVTHHLPWWLWCRTRLGSTAFSFACPAAWNSLPTDIRSRKSTDSFKSQLKTQFFQTRILSVRTVVWLYL